MTEDTENPWKRLTDAARKAPQEPAPSPVSPPRAFDFRKKVTALFLTLLWRRSSVIVALIAGLVWLAIVLFSRCQTSQTPLIPLPPETLTDPVQP